MVFTPRLVAALAGAGLCLISAHARDYRVTVAAAEVDRAVQVVSFPLPADAPRPAQLRGADRTVPLQVATDGTAVFIVERQKAGESLAFTLTSAGGGAAGARDAVTATREAGRLKVTVGGAPVFVYQMDKEALPRPDIKPFFFIDWEMNEIYTPAGKIVSDDYPPQHIHHHGIWSPWTKTSFQGRTPDFWNMGAKTGTVEFVALERTWSGAVHGGFVARHKFVDLSAKPEPVVALHETWEVTAYHAPATVRIFDLQLAQTCATSDPLILPKYHYGGLGFRARGEWYGTGDKARFLTSEGGTDRIKANAQPMRWVHIHGEIDGGALGLAVLGHPGNFRAPQPVRVHPREPYVSFTPSEAGDWQIDPGKPYVARYRFVTVDGPPDAALLEALWQGYARPAQVTVAPRP